MMGPVPVSRSETRLRPDPRRTITKPYLPAASTQDEADSRTIALLARIMALTPIEADRCLDEIRVRFRGRHADLDEVLERGYSEIAHLVSDPSAVTQATRSLIGAFMMHEYAVEGAALTNPSIVAAPDQSGTPAGALRVIVSLRAVGEGHISSIEFRTGVIGPNGQIDLDRPGAAMTGSRRPPIFDKALFKVKLDEMGLDPGLAGQAMSALADRFTMTELEESLARLDDPSGSSHASKHVAQAIHWLASSNYEVHFPPASDISQRLLFPSGPSESHGMEDARFVRFADPDGPYVYYATYTAFDGFSTLPQLVETADFRTFRIATLNGRAVRNKGIALFPRRVGGRYAALARSDGESNYLMVADHVRFWHEAEKIQMPTRPWELRQIGNAGSPIETESGWLVVTHAVGPMRTYVLGATLLDLDDPRRVIGHLREPLLAPDETERDGYVPNVVYSCGSLVHHGHLVIAYGASDTATRFASVPVDPLLSELTRS